MVNIQDVSLVDLLPPSIAQDPTVKSAAQALDAELQAVTGAVQECVLLARVDDLPEPVIDHLAWQLHVDFYEPDLSSVKKRSLVRDSIKFHMRKGTPDIVQEMVSTVLAEGLVYEWWEYSGQPFRFRVETTENVQSEESYQRVISVVNTVKNTRSWLDGIIIRRSINHPMYIGGAQRVSGRVIIREAQ